MKFKTIFLIFNVIISFSFLLIFLMPLFLFGSVTYSVFFKTNWIALVIFIMILAVFNGYFIKNFKLFTLLEEENWFELIKYLEQMIYQKHRIRKNKIKMLLNAYLVTSNTEATARLEKYLQQKRNALIEFFSIQFGIPYLLNNIPEESEKFFGKLLASPHTRYPNWIRWNFGLSLIQQNQLEIGKNEFLKLINEEKDLILLSLTLYILKSFMSGDSDLTQIVEMGIKRITQKFNIYSWQKVVEHSKTNNQEVLVLSKIVDQASAWLFGYLESGDLDFTPKTENII